jgi:hypothetical protein
MIKVFLGDDFDPILNEKIRWLRNTFKADQYCLIDTGFTYPDYYVEFAEERYTTLFRLQWG